MSGQWMPYPPPPIFQFFLWLTEAFLSFGYHAGGTEIVLPSFSDTTSESVVKETVPTRSSAANCIFIEES